MVAGQKITLGRIHARQIVTVHVAEATIAVDLGGEGLTVSTKINNDCMPLEIGGRVVATAECANARGRGHRAHGPSRVTRATCSPQAAITAHGARGPAHRRLWR